MRVIKAIVLVSPHSDDSFSEPFVVVSMLAKPRPLQEFTEKELNLVPQQFRCFACLRLRKRGDIGGIVREQRLCKGCYPWLDEWAVGSLIWWDTKHGLIPLDGKSHPQKGGQRKVWKWWEKPEIKQKGEAHNHG